MYMFRKSASEDVNSVAFFAQMDALIDIEVGLISSARFLAMRVFFSTATIRFKLTVAVK